MRVADLVGAMEAIAPARLAEPWDNVGLLVGDPAAPLGRVLLTVDCTRAVLDEAARAAADAIVAYHPPLFAPVKAVVAGSAAYELARRGIAVHSPHTAFDAAVGGTNDVLADAVEMTDREPLRAVAVSPDTHVKLVTFVPASDAEAVSRAVFDAGGGRIGAYSSCSFRSAGMGTFFGEAGAHPVVGAAGRLEEAAELRVEIVVPLDRTAAAVRALRRAHPYDEPAFDLVRLAAAPAAAAGAGMGRVGAVEPQAARACVERIKRELGLAHVLVAGSIERDVRRVAVCAGSAGDLLEHVLQSRADLLLAGELRHHDALRAVDAGVTVVCTLHSASERCALGRLERGLAERLPGVVVQRSAADREPFEVA